MDAMADDREARSESDVRSPSTRGRGRVLMSFSMPPSAASSASRQAGFAFRNVRRQIAKVGAERNVATTTSVEIKYFREITRDPLNQKVST